MASLIGKIYFLLLIDIFTICWNILKLYNTFYSANLYNYKELADYFWILNKNFFKILTILFNYWQKKIIYICKYFFIFISYYICNNNTYTYSKISETLRENNFNFDLFRKVYLYFYNKEFIVNDQWLIWFISFVEGDGAIMVHKERLTFVITQKDPLVLNEIKEVLGFGVVKQFKGYSRYIVSNNPHCFLVYLILNGNLVIQHRINQLNRWYNSLIKLKKTWCII